MEFTNFHKIEQSILWAHGVDLDECVYPIHSGYIWMNALDYLSVDQTSGGEPTKK